MEDLKAQIARMEQEIEAETIRIAEERGYLRAKMEFMKVALSCCCSGCTMHNMFLLGEKDEREMYGIHEQLTEKTSRPHGEDEL